MTWSILRTTWDFRMQLISGTPGAVSQLHGPLGIATIAGKVASISFLSLIKLAALISVSIGLVNLFPIPILDGGHLLYYGCEAVLGRPLRCTGPGTWISAGAGGHAGVNGTGNLE
jgi:regulator of sigma E protease